MMKLRRTLCFVVAISIVFGCVGMVAAEDVPKVAAVERATGSFKTTVKPGVIAKRTTKLPLEAGEEVTIKATYSPYSVSVDVGLIDSDGIFHFITVSDGIIDEKIAVTERFFFENVVFASDNIKLTSDDIPYSIFSSTAPGTLPVPDIYFPVHSPLCLPPVCPEAPLHFLLHSHDILCFSLRFHVLSQPGYMCFLF